jgi:hypothetical protein
VEEALKAGFSVTAFARDPEKLALEHAQLAVYRESSWTGMQLRWRFMERAVISALGPTSNKPELPSAVLWMASWWVCGSVGFKVIVTAEPASDDAERGDFSRLMDACRRLARNVNRRYARGAGQGLAQGGRSFVSPC